jgi:hypothetical protein
MWKCNNCGTENETYHCAGAFCPCTAYKPEWRHQELGFLVDTGHDPELVFALAPAELLEQFRQETGIKDQFGRARAFAAWVTGRPAEFRVGQYTVEVVDAA